MQRDPVALGCNAHSPDLPPDSLPPEFPQATPTLISKKIGSGFRESILATSLMSIHLKHTCRGALALIAFLPLTMLAGEFVSLTNQAGVTVRAMILDRHDDTLRIKREDGAEFNLGLSSLSEESKKTATKWKAPVFSVQVYPPLDASTKDRLSQTRFVVKGPNATTLGFFPGGISELKEGISECIKLREKVASVTTGQTVPIPLQKVNAKFVNPDELNPFYKPEDAQWLIILDADKRLISLPIKFAATDFDPDPKPTAKPDPRARQTNKDPFAAASGSGDPFAPPSPGGRPWREVSKSQDSRPMPYGLADEWLYFITTFNPQDQLAEFDRIKQIGAVP